jgi:hypothetical protein
LDERLPGTILFVEKIPSASAWSSDQQPHPVNFVKAAVPASG